MSSLSLPNPFNSHDQKSHPPSPTPTATGKPPFVAGKQDPVAGKPGFSPENQDTSVSGTGFYRGMKNDLAEIGGSFKTSFSFLSSNKAVSQISKFASNLLRFDKGGDLEEVKSLGVTDEIIDFVREVSVRPECWTDFPLSLQHKDFSMSNVQKDHATTMEQLVPNLSDLRRKICSYMTEKQFWMIYFILLLPRLNEDDYRLLSTPDIIQVREIVLQKLRNKNKHREDDDNLSVKRSQSSSSETGDWVRLNETWGTQAGERRSESEESSDWLDVEDVVDL